MHVCGSNLHGQIGLPDSKHPEKPTLLLKDERIEFLASGGEHSFYYKSNGELWGFGNNSSGYNLPIFIYNFHLFFKGQIGIGNVEKQGRPVLVLKEKDVVALYCGANHNFLQKKNGEILVWGNNESGQLGIGSYINVLQPFLMMVDPEVKMIRGGRDHSMLLKNNGELYVFGNNRFGQLGIGKEDRNECKLVLLMTDPQIETLCCGVHHSMILKRTDDKGGQVVCWGWNQWFLF